MNAQKEATVTVTPTTTVARKPLFFFNLHKRIIIIVAITLMAAAVLTWHLDAPFLMSSRPLLIYASVRLAHTWPCVQWLWCVSNSLEMNWGVTFISYQWDIIKGSELNPEIQTPIKYVYSKIWLSHLSFSHQVKFCTVVWFLACKWFVYYWRCTTGWKSDRKENTATADTCYISHKNKGDFFFFLNFNKVQLGSTGVSI